MKTASQVESKLETQSLPGHSVMATQTECHIGTQTEPEINKPTRRKARSDNDSYSEDDSEMIVEDDTAKVAWVKRRKPKKKLKYKDPRRSMRVYDVKRKIKTPIIEESEISPSLESEKHVKISKTNEREEHVKNYGDITKSTVTTSKNETVSSTRIKMSESDRKSGLRKELLMEISDSLDEKQGSSTEGREKLGMTPIKLKSPDLDDSLSKKDSSSNTESNNKKTDGESSKGETSKPAQKVYQDICNVYLFPLAMKTIERIQLKYMYLNYIGGDNVPDASHRCMASKVEDNDSGIAMNTLAQQTGNIKRLPITEKKSIFTIAYDDVQTKQLRPDSSSTSY
ncbi:uncharacterized protein [Choristoneura fumiferana]|uniref:uncharacterized protein n=1 Tax=Choristoneura fumiferana TaxID=7141 RepID=UPI003D15B03A